LKGSRVARDETGVITVVEGELDFNGVVVAEFD
jgi:hypothetical protein